MDWEHNTQMIFNVNYQWESNVDVYIDLIS